MNSRQVKEAIDRLLNLPIPDGELREKLEELSHESSFSGLTWKWGPPLYKRNKVMFRPFILSHFSTILIESPLRWGAVEWKGEVERALSWWLEVADHENDIQIFRRLYQWKVTPPKKWQPDRATVCRDLLEKLRTCRTPAERSIVLSKFEIPFSLDEATAVELYRADPQAAKAFILKHLPNLWWDKEKRALWEGLQKLAGAKGDRELEFTLYRRMVPLPVWKNEIMKLCDTVREPGELVESLKMRHPEGHYLDLSDTYYQLALKRGEDVVPYILKNLQRVWFRWPWQKTGFEKLLELARQKGWLGLWAGLVRVSLHPKDYNKEIMDLLENRTCPADEVRARLMMLAGVSREFNFPGFGLAMVRQLDDPVAVKFYERFPELLRGPFKMHLSISWGYTYTRFSRTLIDADDQVLIDFLASRLITRDYLDRSKDLASLVENFSLYYERLREESREFSERACEVLGQIPAFSIYNYNSLIKNNRLARLMFERSASYYLNSEMGLRNLVEAPEIHVQALAYRIAGLDDDRARRIAADNLEMLLGTLLRPLQKKTRLYAFEALLSAAGTLEQARRIHTRAREALNLPDTRYPKEKLLGLIARLLTRWPELRSSLENPIIYEVAAP